jgi:hypothetical protein
MLLAMLVDAEDHILQQPLAVYVLPVHHFLRRRFQVDDPGDQLRRYPFGCLRKEGRAGALAVKGTYELGLPHHALVVEIADRDLMDRSLA